MKALPPLLIRYRTLVTVAVNLGIAAAAYVLAFGLRFRGRLLKVEATKTEATYTLTEGKTLQISHNGNRIKVSRQTPVTQPIVPIAPEEPTPTQPPGREPMVRQPAARRRRRRSQRR